ncbi:MAG: DnaJ domain-containing protein [Endozoicomonas sp.]
MEVQRIPLKAPDSSKLVRYDPSQQWRLPHEKSTLAKRLAHPFRAAGQTFISTVRLSAIGGGLGAVVAGGAVGAGVGGAAGAAVGGVIKLAKLMAGKDSSALSKGAGFGACLGALMGGVTSGCVGTMLGTLAGVGLGVVTGGYSFLQGMHDAVKGDLKRHERNNAAFAETMNGMMNFIKENIPFFDPLNVKPFPNKMSIKNAMAEMGIELESLSLGTVKKQYHQQALKKHGDKTGRKGDEDFKKLSEAHEVLKAALEDKQHAKLIETVQKAESEARQAQRKGGAVPA